MSSSFEILSSSVFTQLSHGRGSSVGIATCYWLDGLGIESRWGEGNFPHLCTPAVGPAQYSNRAYRSPSLGAKRRGRAVNHPLPSSAVVKERVELYIYSRSGPSWPILGWTFTFTQLCYHRRRILLVADTHITQITKTSPVMKTEVEDSLEKCIPYKLRSSVISVCKGLTVVGILSFCVLELRVILMLVPRVQCKMHILSDNYRFWHPTTTLSLRVGGRKR
jgi:hypothetical protein